MLRLLLIILIAAPAFGFAQEPLKQSAVEVTAEKWGRDKRSFLDDADQEKTRKLIEDLMREDQPTAAPVEAPKARK